MKSEDASSILYVQFARAAAQHHSAAAAAAATSAGALARQLARRVGELQLLTAPSAKCQSAEHRDASNRCNQWQRVRRLAAQVSAERVGSNAAWRHSAKTKNTRSMQSNH